MHVDHVIERQVFNSSLEVAMRDMALDDSSGRDTRHAFNYMRNISEHDDNLVPTHTDINITKGVSTMKRFCNQWRKQVRQRWRVRAGGGHLGKEWAGAEGEEARLCGGKGWHSRSGWRGSRGRK